MPTQTIRIVVQEQGSKQAAANISGIGTSAKGSISALDLLKTALAALGVGSLVKQFIDLSNSYTTLQNRIRLVTTSQQEQVAVTRALLDVSNQTFTSVRDTTELYARLAFNTRNLGLSQKEVLVVTKALNQAVILSGAGTREASNAIIQLSQGLASGTLRGDELRSVLEQLPFVADVIAKGFDVDRDALRSLAAAGLITSEEIVRAFQKAAPEISAQFAKITPTIGQAFIVLQNQILNTIGEFNKATGASDALASSILAISNSVQDFSDIAVGFFQEFSPLITTAGDLIADVFGIKLKDAKFGFRDLLRFVAAFIDGLTGLFVSAGQGIAQLFVSVGNKLLAFYDRLGNAIGSVVVDATNLLIKGVNAALTGASKSLNALIDLANSASEFVGGGKLFDNLSFGKLDLFSFKPGDERKYNDIGKEVGAAFRDGFQKTTGAGDFVADILRNADQQKVRRNQEKANAKAILEGTVAGSGKRGRSKADVAVEVLSKQLNAERELLAIGQVKGQLEFNQGQAIIRLNQKLKEGSIELNDAQRQTVESLIKGNEELKIRNDLNKQVDDYTKTLEDQLHILTLSTDEREVEADILRVTNQFKDAGLQIDQQQIDALRALRTEVQQRQQDEQLLNGIFGDREATLKRIADLERLRQQETDPAKRRGIEREQAQQRINTRQGDPTLIAGFENGLDQLFLKVSDVAGGIEAAMTNAFSGAEDALVKFVQTGEFNLSGLVDSILADITRLLARQAVLALFNTLSGGTSGAFGGVLASLAGARAEGGPVSANKPFLVGERGPEIFTPPTSGNIVPNAALQGQAPQTNITVVNVTDPGMVTAALNDPANQQVIVNVIGRNKQAVNRTLGNG